MKTCTKCGLEKGEDGFYFENRRQRLQSSCKECAHTYHVLNKERICENRRNRYLQNPEPAKIAAKKQRENQNPIIAREYFRTYRARRYAGDLKFKTKMLLRARLGHALEDSDSKKTASTLDLLGCEVEHLNQHLESLFKPGMTWENHGPVWHIDHIKPCAAFDLTDPDQQRACFHWTNLQPLFATENLSKGYKYIP